MFGEVVAAGLNLLAARNHMAVSLGFHIVLACLGIGFPLITLISHWRGLRTGSAVLTLSQQVRSPPQPVPPIYQPELAAEAIHDAVREKRRELYVAWPTVKTIVGNKLGSAVVDHYLAANGVKSQLTDRPAAPTNANGNLFEPVPGDPGAHGSFDERSRSFSPQMWLSEHRGMAALTLGGAILAGWLVSR